MLKPYLAKTLGLSALLLAGLAPGTVMAQQVARDPCPAWTPDMRFDCYHDYEEQEAMMRAMAAAYPELATLESVGKTYQGRELWLLKITDQAYGAPEDKPGIWVEGGVDSDEVTSVEAALATAHRLLTSNDAETRDLLRTRTFYIIPNIIPDTSELWHHSALRPTDSTQKPFDEDSDGLKDEDPPEDLNGDGQITMMRWIDPLGSMVLDEKDPRLLRPRRAGDEGPFYKTAAEGVDSDGDESYNEDWLGGIDPNRSYPFFWNAKEQTGAGLFGGSGAEIHSLLTYIADHPNIASSLHFHTAGGVILYPMGVPEVKMPASDMALFKSVAREGLVVTGYDLATPVIDWNWPAGTSTGKPDQVWRDDDGELQVGTPVTRTALPSYLPGTYPAYGGSLDTLYPVFGILAYAMELYEMAPDLNDDGEIDDLDRLIQNDRKLGGVAFAPWTKFQHPELGEVEIGGWRKIGQNNPLLPKLDEEAKKGAAFAYVIAKAAPMLAIQEVNATPVGNAYRVTANIANMGQQPTELAVRAGQEGVPPVLASLELPEGATLVSSRSQIEVGRLAGWSDEPVEWAVSAPSGSEVTIVAWHPKAGATRQTVRLP